MRRTSHAPLTICVAQRGKPEPLLPWRGARNSGSSLSRYVSDFRFDSLIWSRIARCSRRRAGGATHHPRAQWIIRQSNARNDPIGLSERVMVNYGQFLCESDIVGNVNVQWLTRLGNVSR